MASVVLPIVLTTFLHQFYGDPVVLTSNGAVRGTYLTTRKGREIPSFMNIPYAESPTGNLRFRNPVPKKPWIGILDATRSGNPCTQVVAGGVVGSEDCLSLNVYTPKLPKPSLFPWKHRLLPVMVYIYGGGYTQGSNSPNATGPNFLLDKDIVLVTVNYRLGIFGFLSTGDDVASGNYGLKDQRLALQWVQKNIHNFGGDPKRVTLFGESAGGASVNLHAFSDSSKDLFHQYIIQSGSVLTSELFRDYKEYYSKPSEVAAAYNCPTTDSSAVVNCLRGLSKEQLANSTFVFDKVQTFLLRVWGPVVEKPSKDAFITENPRCLIRKNKLKDAPYIIGVDRNEGLLFTAIGYVDDKLYEELAKNLTVPTMIFVENYDQTRGLDLTELSSKTERFYLGSENPRNRTRIIEGFTDLSSDIFFHVPAVEEARYSALHSVSPVYMYLLSYEGSRSQTFKVTNNTMRLGVSHADDLFYLFPSDPKEFGLPANDTLTEDDNKVVDIMVDLWTNFATNGFPTSEHLDDPFLWKPYSKSQNYLEIGDGADVTVRLKQAMHKERIEFWERETRNNSNTCSS